MSGSQAKPLTHFILALITSAVIFGLQAQGRLDWLANSVNMVLRPWQTPFVALQRLLDGQLEFLRDLPHQERIIKDLKRRNAQLALTADKAAQLEKENQSLHQALRSPTPLPLSLIPAKVTSVGRYAVLNQGSLVGIKVGQTVISDNVFLGQIKEVLPRAARVVLLTDPETSLTVRTASNTKGILRYQGNVLKLTEVLQKDPLIGEESLYTLGSETTPDGLLVGSIKKLDTNPSGVYKTATVEPAANVNEIEVMLVIVN